MPASFLAFSLFVGAIVAVAWTIAFGRPLVARARFTTELSRLRDKVEDMVFMGEVPDAEPVQFFWSKLTVLKNQPELVSLSQALAIETVPSTITPPVTPSIDDLPAAARERMHAVQDEFLKAMADYICNGSSVWPVMAVVRRIPLSADSAPSASPETLAAHYDDSLNRARERDANGMPEFSPRLLTPAF